MMLTYFLFDLQYQMAVQAALLDRVPDEFVSTTSIVRIGFVIFMVSSLCLIHQCVVSTLAS
jgi:hypothetical protein